MSLNPVPPRRPLVWDPLVEQLEALAPDPARLYLVGGVVRDALRGRPAHDIDLVTPDDGLETARHLANALDGAYFPVDQERRTGRALVETPGGSRIIDVASFRGGDLLADLQDRDFTINAMAVRLDQLDRLIDPLGGQDDLLTARLLRQCNPTSIISDPIRALRAVRHSLQFGLRMENHTLAAARSATPLHVYDDRSLRQPERVRDELFKTLAKARPSAALRVLHALDLLAVICPFKLPDDDLLNERFSVTEHLASLLAIISPERDDNTASELILGVAVMVLDRYRRQLQEHLFRTYADGRPRTVLLLLAALTPPGRVLGDGWGARLRLSSAESHVLTSLGETGGFRLTECAPLDDRQIHRYYRHVGEEGVDGVLLTLAEYLAAHWPVVEPERWGDLLEEVASPLIAAYFRRHQQVVAPPPLLTGKELMGKLDVKPGPQIGDILERLLEEQAAGEIRTKKQALNLAKRLVDEAPFN